MTEPLNLARMKFVVEDELLQDPQPNVMDVVNAELREKLEAIAAKAERRKGQCQECDLDAVKGRRKCIWHIEAKMSPDQRAAAALERRAAWDGTRKRADGSCAGCGAQVPTWYTTGSRCKSCAVLDRRKTEWKLTDDQQRALAALSGGKCMGCLRGQTFKALAVDHRHDDNKIRGLLEQECNTAVGAFHDDPLRFMRIAVYLLAPPADVVLDPDNALSDRQIGEEVIKLLKIILEERHGD